MVGGSDARGEEVDGQPVHPADLIASIYGQLGISTEAHLPHPEGLKIRAVPVGAGGPLRAIL